jgi:hypothetical protein
MLNYKKFNEEALCRLFNSVDASVSRLSSGSYSERDGPRQRLLSANFNIPSCRRTHIDLVVVGFQRSLPRFKAALRLWGLFSNHFQMKVFPIQEHTIRLFVTLFRNSTTARNYIASIKSACKILEIDHQSWDSKLLRGLIENISKLPCNSTCIKIKEAIRKPLLLKLVEKAEELSTQLHVWSEVKLILILSYMFLFRVPSECLPLEFGSTMTTSSHSSLTLTENRVQICLKRRKNSNTPVTLIRACVCAFARDGAPSAAKICPVHQLVNYLRRLRARSGSLQNGHRLFSVNANQFTYRLRMLLQLTGLTEAQAGKFSSHSLRRGSARDILKSTGNVEILKAAGLWFSSEYESYIDKEELATSAMLEMVIDDEEED